MGKETGADVATSAPSELPAEVMRRFADMAMLLPQADGDGAARIVDALLGAASPFDLNTPWETESSKALGGRTVQIDAVTVQRSDFTEGLGVFLVVSSVDLHTGEAMTFTTGSISVVAQLTRAHIMGWLPLVAEIVQAERPTSKGFFPIHLRVIQTGATGKGRTDGQ